MTRTEVLDMAAGALSMSRRHGAQGGAGSARAGAVSGAARVAKGLAVADASEIASDVAVQLAEIQGRVVEAVKLLTCSTRHDWWPDRSAASCGLCSNCRARALLSGDVG